MKFVSLVWWKKIFKNYGFSVRMIFLHETFLQFFLVEFFGLDISPSFKTCHPKAKFPIIRRRKIIPVNKTIKHKTSEPIFCSIPASSSGGRWCDKSPVWKITIIQIFFANNMHANNLSLPLLKIHLLLKWLLPILLAVQSMWLHLFPQLSPWPQWAQKDIRDDHDEHNPPLNHPPRNTKKWFFPRWCLS